MLNFLAGNIEENLDEVGLVSRVIEQCVLRCLLGEVNKILIEQMFQLQYLHSCILSISLRVIIIVIIKDTR